MMNEKSLQLHLNGKMKDAFTDEKKYFSYDVREEKRTKAISLQLQYFVVFLPKSLFVNYFYTT